MKIDFHVHTDISPCAATRPELVVRVAKKRGLDAIAIVNHNKLLNFNPRNFKVIPGEEVRTKQGEIIGLFLKKEIPGGLNAQKTIDLIKAQGGIVTLPHMFDPLRRGLGNHVFNLKNVDFVELNGRCLFNKFNNKVIDFSKKHMVPLVGGSDAHYYSEIGHVITDVKADTIDDAIERLLYNQGRVLKRSIGSKKYEAYFKSMLTSAYRKSLKRVL
jgi:predicted metal-dependent phosphoesterase TrpH